MVLSWYSKRDLSRHDKDNEQLSLLHDMEEGRVVFRRGRVIWPKDTTSRWLGDELMSEFSFHSDSDDLLMAAKARLHWAEKRLAQAESKAVDSGNYYGQQMTLDKLRDEVTAARGYLEHIEAKHDVAFGGIK